MCVYDLASFSLDIRTNNGLCNLVINWKFIFSSLIELDEFKDIVQKRAHFATFAKAYVIETFSIEATFIPFEPTRSFQLRHETFFFSIGPLPSATFWYGVPESKPFRNKI